MSSFESAFFLTISRPKQLSLLLRRLPSSSLFTIGYQDFLVRCCANVCTFEDKWHHWGLIVSVWVLFSAQTQKSWFNRRFTGHFSTRARTGNGHECQWEPVFSFSSCESCTDRWWVKLCSYSTLPSISETLAHVCLFCCFPIPFHPCLCLLQFRPLNKYMLT